MIWKSYMTHKKRIIIGATVMSPVLAFCCCWLLIYSRSYIRIITIQYTRLKIPHEESQLEKKISQITSVSDDVLLEKRGEGLSIVDDPTRNAKCIIGGKRLIYGSDLSYDVIVSRYEAKMQELGIQRNPDRGIGTYKDQGETLFITISKGHGYKHPPLEWELYPTTYTFIYEYYSPSYDDCVWR